jgi:CheY-like chemotaxis protein
MQPMRPLNQALINWTHEALSHFFDLPFLERHCRAAVLKGQFTDGRALQEFLSGAVTRLRPPIQATTQSPAWRIYNVLNLRYIQGLTQSEAAVQLNIGTRQLRREQRKAIEAAAALLAEQIGAAPSPAPPPPVEPPEPPAHAIRDDELVHVDELLRSALGLMDPLVEGQHLTLELALSGDAPVVQARRMVMRQLLISALNWLIHDRSDCVLGVAVHADRHCVVLQLSKPRHTTGQDSGLTQESLANVVRLAEMMRAAWHLNETPESLTLEVAFPTCEVNFVVLIDDNLDAVQLVQRYLQQSSEFQLVAITNADEALQKVRALRPACILLDVMMPERDGWELLTLFGAYPETAGIPVIISSVLKEHELARALGAADVLPKPYSAAQLVAILRSTISRSRPAPAPPAG